MTDKQARFCSEYLTHRSARVAAKAAGYPPGRAQAVLKSAGVRRFLERNTRDGAIIGRDEIIAGLSQIARGEMTEQERDKNGTLHSRPPTIRERAAALNMLLELADDSKGGHGREIRVRFDVPRPKRPAGGK